MAITKTITADGSRGNHRFSLTLTESRTEGNSSFLDGSFTLYPVKSGTHWNWYYWGENISYSVNVGGNAYSGYIPNYDGTSVLYLVQISNLEIPHNTDGTKTIDISFSVTDNAGQAYTPGNASANGTMELSLLHKSPEITSIDIVEENEILTTIGVGDDEFVNQLSKKTIAINTTFYDNAVGSNYKINIDPYVYTSTVSIVDVNIENRDINYDSGNNVNVVASVTDSFGATSSYSVLRNFIPYQKPNIITTRSSVKRAGQITGKANLNLEGTFFNGNIRTVTNTISLSYKYWVIGGTEPEEYFAIPTDAYTIDNNNFSMYNWGISKNNVEIEDLDKSKAYNFKIKVVDSLNSSYEVTLVCSKGEWLMAKFKDRVDFQKITIGGYNPFKYSEDETVIGEWVDGRPIYRKVINSTSSLSAGFNYINHGINNFDKLVNHRLYVYYNTDNYVGGAFQDETTFVTLVYVSPEKANINVGSTWGASFKDGFTLILEYIKTTDEGGL